MGNLRDPAVVVHPDRGRGVANYKYLGMPGNGKVRLELNATCTIYIGIKPFACHGDATLLTISPYDLEFAHRQRPRLLHRLLELASPGAHLRPNSNKCSSCCFRKTWFSAFRVRPFPMSTRMMVRTSGRFGRKPFRSRPDHDSSNRASHLTAGWSSAHQTNAS